MPLAPQTTFGLGGPARFFVRVHSTEALTEALGFAEARALPVLVLGGGSNLLVGDSGFSGLVIKLETKGIRQEGHTLFAAAGESWDALVSYTVEAGLWGLENLSGIPGSVGGAVVQGIGAYGAAIGQTLASVEVFDCKTKEVRNLDKAACAFDYRTSVFKKEEGRYIVLRAALTLSPEPNPNTTYRDLAEWFSGTRPTLEALRAAVLAIRKEKFPDLALEGTAGSFFKNPIVSAEVAEGLRARYPGLPTFAMPETEGYKVALAWLLDHVLGLKGCAVGGARLFERQPLVIAASRNATATDVVALARDVQKIAKEKLDLVLEPEVKIIF